MSLPTTQSKITGELEATFTTAMCRSSNLQSILDHSDITSNAQPLLDAFTKVANEDHRGTRLADEIHHPPTKPPQKIYLSDIVYQLLVSFLNQHSNTIHPTTIRDSHLSVPRTVFKLDKLSI